MILSRWRFVSLVLWLFGLGVAAQSAFAFTPTDVQTLSCAFNSAFYVQSGTNGWFKDTQTGGVTYFWGQAEMIECVIDSYEWTSNAATRAQITNLLNGFIYNNSSAWNNYTPYNDDVMWAVIAFTRGGMDTGRTNYCALAKANFDACYARAYDTVLGGGLYWKYPDNASKNACVNGPAAIAAYLLYQVYGDASYLNKATNIYAWERNTLFNAANGAIADNIGTNGIVNGGATTYNQGTFLGAADFLGATNDALLAANFTMMNMTAGGILPEYGIAGNNSGFNAIFIRWLARFMRNRNLKTFYESWLQTNAVAAWNGRRTFDGLSWCQWLHPTPAGTNFYAWDCISSYEAMQAADPTQGIALQAVPGNFCGYWPLDATSGTIAVDATGSGNNGFVNNAAWNSNGRFNGCLAFSGNGSVQITNPVANDFTISLWVNTTQSAPNGQWYNGAGLVDGDVPFSSNDFGTALVGGKFAVGIGNPDTTILSTSSINDGNWHHCVATRQQATGTVSVYVDGVMQNTGIANCNTLNAPAKLLFGAIASGSGYFTGRLDEIKIFNRALTSNEVAGLYSNTVVRPPSSPTNLLAAPGNARVSLSWSDAALATGYNVKRSLVTGGPYVTITNIVAPTFVDMDLTNNRTCYYVVSATNLVGEGPNSSEASATPNPLTSWFKADAITNSNGANISVWPDSSGSGFNALQPLSGNQPTLVSTAMNGQPAVRFNSANSDFLWFFRSVQDDFTLMVAFQSSQGLGTSTAFYSGAGLVNGEVGGVANDFGMSLNTNGQVLAGTGNPDTSINSTSGFNHGVPHIATFKRTKNTGALALYVDGNLAAAANSGTQSLNAPNELVIGAQQTIANFLTGDIGEIQIYGTALSDTDRLGYERALKCKYGIVGSATPAAPTSLTLSAGNRKVLLNWTMAAGASSYNIWRSLDASAYDLIATGISGSSYVDTSAANGKTNYYRVTGSDACGAGSYSSVSSVLLPLPILDFIAAGNALTVSWPGWANDWQLYSATNLTPPINWSPVLAAASSNNNSLSVTVPIGTQSEFFRLGSP